MSSASEYLRRAAAKDVQEVRICLPGIDEVRILEAYREAAAEMAAGNLSLIEARRQVREYLVDIGFNPSRDSLDAALQTCSDLAAGRVQHEAGMLDIANPGQELYRATQAREPRDWATRWASAAAEVGWEGVARDGSFIALKTSPIWAALSRFGYPYPPFDFKSGMWVRSVDDDTCERLGLLEGDWLEKMLRAAEENDLI